MDDPVSAELQVWIDKRALAELVAALSSAVDRADRERIASCYDDDSYDDHGSFKGSGREFADFICGSATLGRMHHLVGQSVFDIDGAEAWGETFFVFHGAAGGRAVSGHGRYVDYFCRSDRGWKLKYRRVVPDAVPAGDDLSAYWSAARDRTDPVYDRLRRPPETAAGT